MKRFDFLESDGAAFGQASRQKPDALVLSPLHAHTYLLALPPLKGDKIGGAVRFRLRSLHPGNPETTRIDHLQNGPVTGNVLAFAIDSGTLGKYREHGIPLVPSTALLNAGVPGKGRFGAFLFHSEWTEAAVIEDARIIFLESAPSSGNTAEDARHAAEAIRAGSASVPDMAFASFSTASEAGASEAVEALRGCGFTDVIRVSGQALSEASKPSRAAVFPVRKRRTRHGKKTAAVFLAIDLVLAALAFDRAAIHREAELARVKDAYTAVKVRASEAERARRDYEEAAAEYAAAARKKPADLFGGISGIVEALGDSAWIRSLTFRDAAYQFEAEGTDSLLALSHLERSPLFEATRLHQAAPSPVRGEVFTVSGRLRRDGQ